MTDAEQTRALRASLAADGYGMEIAGTPGRVSVTITATPRACADCLVPKDLMRGILGRALGVAPDRIDLTYPADGPGAAEETGKREAEPGM
jgi:hypothetical protein